MILIGLPKDIINNLLMSMDNSLSLYNLIQTHKKFLKVVSINDIETIKNNFLRLVYVINNEDVSREQFINSLKDNTYKLCKYYYELPSGLKNNKTIKFRNRCIRSYTMYATGTPIKSVVYDNAKYKKIRRMYYETGFMKSSLKFDKYSEYIEYEKYVDGDHNKLITKGRYYKTTYNRVGKWKNYEYHN